MFESLITAEIARTVVGLAVGFWLWNYLRREEEIPCKRCEHLEIIGGAVWKYECRRNGQYNGFDRPPKYCKYFKERCSDEDVEDAILFVKDIAAAPVKFVTFCKDCEYCKQDNNSDYQCWHFRNYGTKAAAVGALDFCSYGKPKEAENDE